MTIGQHDINWGQVDPQNLLPSKADSLEGINGTSWVVTGEGPECLSFEETDADRNFRKRLAAQGVVGVAQNRVVESVMVLHIDSDDYTRGLSKLHNDRLGRFGHHDDPTKCWPFDE